MGDSTDRGWVKLLFGGLGVAAFTFAAPIVWQKISHRSLGPDSVVATMRLESDVLFLVVRNSSNEPLDIVEAEIEIDGVKGTAADELAAYPTPSHLYEVDSRSAAELKQQGERLFLKLKIAQAIEPGQVDQFGFKIKGPSGSLTPAAGALKGKIKDVRGNVYLAKY